jgi:hypothetical protein
MHAISEANKRQLGWQLPHAKQLYRLQLTSPLFRLAGIEAVAPIAVLLIIIYTQWYSADLFSQDRLLAVLLVGLEPTTRWGESFTDSVLSIRINSMIRSAGRDPCFSSRAPTRYKGPDLCERVITVVELVRRLPGRGYGGCGLATAGTLSVSTV